MGVVMIQAGDSVKASHGQSGPQSRFKITAF